MLKLRQLKEMVYENNIFHLFFKRWILSLFNEVHFLS